MPAHRRSFLEATEQNLDRLAALLRELS